jgi:PIF1-like helicase
MAFLRQSLLSKYMIIPYFMTIYRKDIQNAMASLGLEVRYLTATPEGLRELYELLTNHHGDVLAALPTRQLIVKVHCDAGCGKGQIIESISMTLEGMAEEAGIDETPILRAGTTATAAFNANGRTLHSIFRIPRSTSNQYNALDAGNAQSLRADLQNVSYIIVDEGEMVGSTLEFWMDRRCRDIFPSRQGMPFGGLNIVVVGNTLQLLPVQGLFDD